MFTYRENAEINIFNLPKGYLVRLNIFQNSGQILFFARTAE